MWGSLSSITRIGNTNLLFPQNILSKERQIILKEIILFTYFHKQ